MFVDMTLVDIFNACAPGCVCHEHSSSADYSTSTQGGLGAALAGPSLQI